MAGVNENKVMSAKEAINRFVNDGDELIIGSYTTGTCCELVSKSAARGKKFFTLYSQPGTLDIGVIVNAWSVDRLGSTCVLRWRRRTFSKSGDFWARNLSWGTSSRVWRYACKKRPLLRGLMPGDSRRLRGKPGPGYWMGN